MTTLLSRFLRPYRRHVLVVLVLLLVQAISNLYLPSLNADIINNGVVLGDTGYILRVGGIMLLVTLLLGIAAVIAVYHSARIAMSFGRDVRSALFRRVEEFSLREVNSFGAPSLITRNTNDVQQLQVLVVMGLMVMVSAPITAVGGVIMAVRENAKLSLLLLVVIPVMAVVVGSVIARAVPLFRSMQARIDRVNQVARETLAGIRVVRAFVRTAHEESRFDAANADLTDAALRVNRLFALMMPSLMLVMNLSSVAIVWFGAGLIDSGQMPIGNLTAFLSYLMQILLAVMMATFMVVMVPRAQASAERIQAVLGTEPCIADPATTPTVTPAPQAPQARLPATGVVFRDVEFRYPGAQEPVLRDVDLAIEPGRTTAIVGGTGSGKTTLLNLIPRLYDVTGGRLLVGGSDVREVPQETLWRSIGLVPQRSFLFAGTVASNLRVGDPDATDDDLWRALRVAQAADFVSALPEGLDAPIDQGGANLSGGQRQRLAVARAVVRRPDVYLLDDSFSALDFATDARLRAALREHTREATVVIVAQRVSTIMYADRIVVMDEGRIVGTGTHAELMVGCPTYAEIVLSQLSEADVA